MAKESAISFIGWTAIAVLLLFCGPSNVRGGAPESSDDQGANTTTYQAWQDHLAGEGITISFQWQADVFGNVRGGSREGALTDGLIRQDLDLDCQKLTRLAFFDDTEIHVEGMYPYGTDISTLVGDIGGVNNNAAYNSPRLNEIWFQRRFQVGTANSSVRTGLMGADQEFDVNGTGSLFINSSFGAPLGLSGNARRLPNDRNFITVSVDAGAVYKGIFRRQKESQDSLGIGFVYNSVSDNVRHAVAVARNEGVQGVLNFESEPVLEATYVLPVTGHWQLQPDLQWVIRPGSSDAFRNALVIGLRSSLTF